MNGVAQPLPRRIYSRLPSRLRGSRLIRIPARRWIDRQDRRLVERVRPYSMVPEPALLDLCVRVRQVVDNGIPGDIVECGVWRGGSAFLMAELVKRRGDPRKVWLFDSFEGLPPPRDIDGPRAAAYAADRDSPEYYDNCRAAMEEVRSAARSLGVDDRTELVQGWFEETLPAHREAVGRIALLRLDCDWYESVMTCLASLYDQVSPGGLVVLDDYYAWDGCAIAAHEFLARRSLPHRLHEAGGVAFFWKV